MTKSEAGSRPGAAADRKDGAGSYCLTSGECIWETMKKYRTWRVVTATPLGTLVVWVNFVTSLPLYPDWSRT